MPRTFRPLRVNSGRRGETMGRAWRSPVEFRVLGPLEVEGDDHELETVTPTQRDLLGLLLVHANEVVSTDRIIDALWGERASSHVATLHVHVSNLRHALQPDRRGRASVIATRSPGYVLQLGPSDLDAWRFERMQAQALALRLRDPVISLDLLDEGLGLWRGPALADFEYRDWARPEALRLTELRSAAQEHRLDLLLALGKNDQVVSDARSIVADEPLQERPRAALMLALYRTGRQAESLDVFGDFARELGDAKGIAPSGALSDLEMRIVLQDPSLGHPDTYTFSEQSPERIAQGGPDA